MFSNRIANVETISPDSRPSEKSVKEFTEVFSKALDIRRDAQNNDIYPVLINYVEDLQRFSSADKYATYKEMEKILTDVNKYDENYIQNDREMLMGLLQSITIDGENLGKALDNMLYKVVKDIYPALEDSDIYLHPEKARNPRHADTRFANLFGFISQSYGYAGRWLLLAGAEAILRVNADPATPIRDESICKEIENRIFSKVPSKAAAEQSIGDYHYEIMMSEVENREK